MEEQTTKTKKINPLKIAEDIVQKGNKILDPKQRAAYVAARLEKHTAKVVAWVLRVILDKASRRNSLYREFLESGLDSATIRELLGTDKFSRLYYYALEEDMDDVLSLFTNAPPARSAEGDDDLFQVYGASDRTIGERKWLARSRDKSLLDKIGYDPNPHVIRQLLLNPRTTEPDVVKIASRRPNSPHVLEEIFKNKKWVARYSLKMALAANPYCPPRIALSLLPFLMLPDLRLIAFDGVVAEKVQQEARRIYEQTKGEPLPEPDWEEIPETPVNKKPKKVYKIDV